MKPNAEDILSEEGKRVLREFTSKARCLIALDFDGTLAPITNNPSEAVMKKRVFAALGELSNVADILILTGRSVDDARRRVPQNVKYLRGNHGLEGSETVSRESIVRAYQTTQDWLSQLGLLLSHDPEFSLEDKKYSLSVHFRQAEDEKQARLKLQGVLARLVPQPTLIDGKCVMNVMPPGLPNKKTALIEMLNEGNYSHAIFVGDDLTDNYVFECNDPRVLSIKIGRSRLLAAPWFLRSQSAIEDFLRLVFSYRNASC